MDSIIEYIVNPQTLVSIVIFIFWLGMTWSKLNTELKEIERRVNKIEDLDLDRRLTEIQTNLKWIMDKMEKLK